MTSYTTNEKATGGQPDGFSNLTTNNRKFSHKSTATEAQYQRSIVMLRSGEQSTIALRKAGVMMPAARIKELNDRYGYNIIRVALRDLWDEWGFCHPRVAIYALISEPIKGWAAP